MVIRHKCRHRGLTNAGLIASMPASCVTITNQTLSDIYYLQRFYSCQLFQYFLWKEEEGSPLHGSSSPLSCFEAARVVRSN